MAMGRGSWPDALKCPQSFWGRESSGPAVSLQHMEFRTQLDLDNILTWQPSEVSPM